MTPYELGYQAFNAGKGLDTNPFPFIDVDEETDHRQWVGGWYDAQDDAKP